MDSVPWQREDANGFLRRVEVRVGGTVDTVRDVLTADQPVVVGDTVVLGFNHYEDEVTGTFAFNPRTKQRDTVRLAGTLRDFDPTWSNPSFSPGGGYVGYVGILAGGQELGMVRTWPALERKFAGPRIAAPPSDFLVNGTRWWTQDAFVAYVDLGGSPHNGWARTQAWVDHGTSWTDTIAVGLDTVHMDEWKGGQTVLLPGGHSTARLKYKAIWDHGRTNASRLHLAPCPEGAVRTTLRYVELDSAGARESSLDFNESDIESLTTWDDEGQDGVVVITGFSLNCASANPDSAVIRVEWQNVGLASREGDSTRLIPPTDGMPSHQDFVVKR
jgi:hypothetical protein